MFQWPVVPLCERQLRDVNPNDVLSDGLYRRCDIYKGDGGYDKFESVYHSRFGGSDKLNEQFVVQVRGCPFKCPYCYVTPDGINGEAVMVSTTQLRNDFIKTGLPVFHLMGGAPALYLEEWTRLIAFLPDYAVFHSDFLLQEGLYSADACGRLALHKRQLHAVSVKGSTPEEFKANTGVDLKEDLFWRNLEVLVHTTVPFYFTFTGMSPESVARFKAQATELFGDWILTDSFAIDIVHYKALD